MKSVMRSIFKKYSIFIVAILNLLMLFIISCIVFYWSGYIRDQYNIMNDGEYFDTFYLFCIVIFVFSLIYFLRQYILGIYKVFYLLYIVLLILFVSKTINCIIYYKNYSKEEYIKSHKVSLQNLNYIIKDTGADNYIIITIRKTQV